MIASLTIGDTIDRYKVLGVLGEGGMAIVYKARHVELGTLHAMKLLTLRGRGLADRLLQEGRIQARIRHPNIVSVTDVVRVEGQPALVMEYIDGPPLDVLLRSYQPTLAQVDDLAQGILAGVGHAHKHGMIHRDLKPGNILVVIDGDKVIPKVTDFGLAKILAEDGPRLVNATRTGISMGTPTFMAPEQFKDAKTADGRADVFSLGALLYELLTGASAFEGDNVIDVYQAMRLEQYRKVKAWRTSVPDRMERAIEGSLRAEPDNRWPTTNRLLEVWRGEDSGNYAPIANPAWEPQHVDLIRSIPRLTPPMPPPSPVTNDPPNPTITPSVLDIPVAVPPQKETRRSVGRFIGGAFAILAGATVLGLLAGAIVATLSIWSPRDVEGPQRVVASSLQVETPVVAPEPVAPEPVAVAMLVPPPSPVEPTAAASVVPAPKPRPVVPVAAPTVAPEPVVDASAAVVRVSGVERAYLVDPSGARQPVGSVAPGTYDLLVFFDASDPTVVLSDLAFAAGETREFRCNAGLRVCK